MGGTPRGRVRKAFCLNPPVAYVKLERPSCIVYFESYESYGIKEAEAGFIATLNPVWLAVVNLSKVSVAPEISLITVLEGIPGATTLALSIGVVPET